MIQTLCAPNQGNDIRCWIRLESFQVRGKVAFEQLLSNGNQHSTADFEEKVKAQGVGEQGIPETNDIGKLELLGEKQCDPTERIEVGIETFVLAVLPESLIIPSQHLIESQNACSNAKVGGVECLAKVVHDFRHQVGETKERVSLSIFSVLWVMRVGGEGVVDRAQHLVHALNVVDARIQLGIDKQDSSKGLVMTGFTGRAVLVEEVEMREGSTDILVDFGLHVLVLKVSVPPARRCVAQWMVFCNDSPLFHQCSFFLLFLWLISLL